MTTYEFGSRRQTGRADCSKSYRRSRIGTLLSVIGLLLMLTISGAAYADGDTPAARESTEFQAADLSKHKEDLSGIPFMVGAYMIIWSGLFLYIYSMHKRTGQVSTQLAELQAALKAHDDAQRNT